MKEGIKGMYRNSIMDKKLTLNNIANILNDIVENKNTTKEEKRYELYVLLGEMSSMYSIPFIYNGDYEVKNKSVIEVFDSIKEEIQKLS